jgi:8-oxo-dGTP diphosphatase
VYEGFVIPVAYLPGSVLKILKEAARHVLRRPVVGIAAIAVLEDGQIVLIRRADTQTWGLPGGTLEWGEALSDCIGRELEEEAGVQLLQKGPIVGVYSGPDRDPRFHGVTVVVTVQVKAGSLRAQNPLEISAVGTFAPDQLPRGLAFGMDDAIDAWRAGKLPQCE